MKIMGGSWKTLNEIRLPNKIEIYKTRNLWDQNLGRNMHDIIYNINSETKNMFEVYSKSGDSKSRAPCVTPS